MADRYIAFDVETPNSANNRISAIGIAVVEHGKVTEEYSTLVDPECEFDRFNVMLTGITPAAVKGAPNFPALWRKIGPLMQSGLLLAHNAPFDMSVLSKCLRRYDLDDMRYMDYACTCAMGRHCFPEMPNHKLDTMCACLGIALSHHRAGSDSRACAELLINYVNCGLEPEDFRRRYDIRELRTLPRKTAGRK